LKDFKSP